MTRESGFSRNPAGLSSFIVSAWVKDRPIEWATATVVATKHAHPSMQTGFSASDKQLFTEYVNDINATNHEIKKNIKTAYVLQRNGEVRKAVIGTSFGEAKKISAMSAAEVKAVGSKAIGERKGTNGKVTFYK